MGLIINAIVLGVEDLKRSKQFYGDGLGLAIEQEQGPYAAFVESAPSTGSRCGNASCKIGPGSTCSARVSCVQDDDHRQSGTRRVARDRRMSR
jgi:catechol 2,3-dioxygenase-like lactoylglutathione lyase family enzyme